MIVRQRLALATLILPVIVVSMDLTVLYLAVPELSRDLKPSGTQLLWIMDVYGFVLASLLIAAGRCGDIIGRRRLLVIGAILFGAASLAASTSPTAEWLTGARALMGLGGATLMPSTLALIRTTFTDEQQRSQAIGLWTAAFAVGGAIGPIIAGMLLEFFSWGVVFVLNVPVVIVLLIGLFLWVDESRAETRTRLPLFGAFVGLLAVLSTMALLKELSAGHSRVRIPILVAASIVTVVGFVLHQRRGRNPLIEPDLAGVPRVRWGLLIVAIGMFALSGPNMSLSQYLQLVLGLSPLEASLAMIPMAVFGIAGAMIGSALASRRSSASVIRWGLLTACVGLVVLAGSSPLQSVALIIAGGIVLSMGVTAFLSTATELTVGAAPEGRAGAVSALSETSSEFGAASSIAVLGATSSFVYNRTLSLPDGLGGGPAEHANDSLQNAIALARNIDGPTGDALTEAARAAFSSGQSLICAVAALMLLILAITLRGRLPTLSKHRSRTVTTDRTP